MSEDLQTREKKRCRSGATGTESDAGSFSVFSEINYNYSGKYMASVSFRTDGSTNFGKDWSGCP